MSEPVSGVPLLVRRVSYARAFGEGGVVERDLWNGADVRWVGPESARAGVPLQPGDRAVVVDAGRHHVTSFGSLNTSSGARSSRPGRGVTVRLVDGSEVVVPHRHLKLLPPDHPLAPSPTVDRRPGGSISSIAGDLTASR